MSGSQEITSVIIITVTPPESSWRVRCEEAGGVFLAVCRSGCLLLLWEQRCPRRRWPRLLSFLAPTPCCPLEAWCGGRQKRTGTLLFPTEAWSFTDGGPFTYASPYPRLQAWPLKMLPLADVIENHWGHRGTVSTWELIPQTGSTSWARGQFSGHRGQPAPPWKTTPYPVPHFLSECMWHSACCQPKIRGLRGHLGSDSLWEPEAINTVWSKDIMG